MLLTWPGRRVIRSFYDPASHRLAVVADVIDDDANVHVYGNRLAITSSATGEFRDLEVLPGIAEVTGLGMITATSVQADDHVTVLVPDSEQPTIEQNRDSTVVVLRLLPAEANRWVRLPRSDIVLGLIDDDVLAAMRVEPELDPDGALEGQWMISLEI